MVKTFKFILLITVIIGFCTGVYLKLFEENLTIKDSKYENKILVNDNSEKNIITDDTQSKATIEKKDYNVLVSSSAYNAVISLDDTTKEIKVKPLDNHESIKNITPNNYINLKEEDVIYLKENADKIMKEFKDGNLLDKYNLLTKMLKDYDTDIKESDLVNIAITYLK